MKNWRNAKLLIGGMVLTTLCTSLTVNSNQINKSNSDNINDLVDSSSNFDENIKEENLIEVIDIKDDEELPKEIDHAKEEEELRKLAYEKIVANYESLTINNLVSEDFELPLELEESKIAWISKNPAIVIEGNSAKVTRPEYFQEDSIGELIATLSNDEINIEKSFTITVIKKVLSNQEKYDLDYNNVNLSQTTITEDFDLEVNSQFGSIITWTSDDSAITINDNHATITRPTFTNGNKKVTLTATIENNGMTSQKHFEVIVIKNEITTAEILLSVFEELDAVMAENQEIFNNFSLPAIIDTYQVNWEVDSPYLEIDGEGNLVVNRPSFTVGDQEAEINVTVIINGETFNKNYQVTIIKNEITTAEIAINLFEDLDETMSNYLIVSENINLPSAIDTYSLNWEVDSPYLEIDGEGNLVVNRPSFTVGNQEAEINVTVIINGETFNKNYQVAILKSEITTAEISINLFEELDEIMSNYQEISNNFSLPAIIDTYQVSWNENSSYLNIDSNGNVVVTTPAYALGNQSAAIDATIIINDETFNKSYSVTILKESAATKAASISSAINAQLNALANQKGIVSLPTTIEGLAITWSSNNMTITSNKINIVPKAYGQGSIFANLTYSFTLETKFTFTHTIEIKQMTAQETKAIADADAEEFYAKYSQYTAFYETEELERTFKNGTLFWESIDGGVSIENYILEGHAHFVWIKVTFTEYGYSYHLDLLIESCNSMF